MKYIPLVGRIYASKKFPEFFYDEKALSLEPHTPTDSIEKIAVNIFIWRAFADNIQ